MRVLIVAVSTGRWRAALSDASWVLDHGGQASLLTLTADAWARIDEPLDPRLAVLELAAAEARHPIRRIERLLVFRLPRLAFRVLRGGLRRAGRLPAVGGPARGAGIAAGRAERRYERLAGRFHGRVFTRLVRPLILFRVVRRYALAGLDMAGLDAVVVADAASIPIGWQLARRYPELHVTFALDREGLLSRVGTASSAA